jgi:chromosome segregation ATPase
MKLSSASDTLDKANISKQEIIDRDTLIHQSLQTQINDLKSQLSVKSRALEVAESNREAAERRLAAFEAKRGQRDLNWEEKYTELSITHTQTINERDAALRAADAKVAVKDGEMKESIEREAKFNGDIADARHQIELLKMRLASVNETMDKASIAKQELAEREALAHQSLQSQINDLKVQLSTKSKALEMADSNREAAERRLAASEAKRNGIEEKYNDLSITHSKLVNERDAALRTAQDKIAAKDNDAKESSQR